MNVNLKDETVSKADAYADTLPKEITGKFDGIDAFIDFIVNDYIDAKKKWGGK